MTDKQRDLSDYDDFYIASAEEAHQQIESATYINKAVKMFLIHKEVFPCLQETAQRTVRGADCRCFGGNGREHCENL